MKIKHANYHSWTKLIKADPLENYGKSDKKRIRLALEFLESGNIKFEIKEADTEFFTWFVPLYKSKIGAKNNPKVQDVIATTVGKADTKLEYQTLTLTQNGKIIGGCIFSDRKNRYSIAYRVFNNSWLNKEKFASPALLTEYLLDKYSFENNKDHLLHGQDRNPYGINSAIGLAVFKLSVGCYAELPINYDEQITDTDKLLNDALILHLPNKDKRITEATLVTTEDNLGNYKQLFAYPDRLKINTLLK